MADNEAKGVGVMDKAIKCDDATAAMASVQRAIYDAAQEGNPLREVRLSPADYDLIRAAAHNAHAMAVVAPNAMTIFGLPLVVDSETRRKP